MTYIIGDLHANKHALDDLLRVIKPKASETLVFLGDYIGKNPYTSETLAVLHRLREDTDCHFLRGNHEFIWEQYLLRGDLSRRDFLLTHGDVEALRSYVEDPLALLAHDHIADISRYLEAYIALFPLLIDSYKIGEYIAVHAGIAPDKLALAHLDFSESDYFLRPERIDMHRKYLGRFRVVGGHTYIAKEPTVKSGYINIDLGAGYGGYIAALDVEKGRIVRSDGTAYTIDAV